MAELAYLKGLKIVLGNMKDKREKYARGFGIGLKRGGLLLQRWSMLEVPVDFGFLKASAFTRADGEGFDTRVTVGYTAAYAIFVHENVAEKGRGQPRHKPSKGNYWDPPGRGKSKFLEDPVKNEDNRKQILETVREAATLQK